MMMDCRASITMGVFGVCLLVAVVTVAPARAFDCPDVCTCEDDEGDVTADCSDRNLLDIPTGFDEFTMTLNLAGNNFSSINQSMFSNFTQLKTLDLSRCQIREIANDTFLPLSASLATLVMDHNLFSSIEAGVFSELQLARLSLSDNNELTEISAEAFVGCLIDRLDLNNCNLSTIHNGTLAPLKDILQELSISNNALELSLPAGELRGFTLSSVTLDNNTLTSFDFLLGTSCVVLEVNKNPIGNNLLSIFSSVEGVEEMYASNTNITKINIDVTSNYSIYVLDISFNQIGILDAEQFKFFPLLVTLNMAGNEIQTIPHDLHKHLPSLAFLDLSGNSIMVLEPGPFTNLQLRQLDVNNNHIQTVPESLRPLLDNMDKFRLEGNPLHCNCELLWFTKWVKQLSLEATDVHLGDCATPVKSPLLNLRDVEFRCTAPMVLFVKPVWVEPRKRVSLQCKAQGDPPPELRITTSVERFTPVVLLPHPNKTNQQTELVFDIPAFDCDEDFGEYRCTAVNVAAEVTEALVINQSSIANDSSCSTTEMPTPTTATTLKPRANDSVSTPKSGAAKDDSDNTDDDAGFIAAIVVCVVLLFIALVIGAYCYWQRKTSQTYKLDPQRNGETKVHYVNEGAEVADAI